MSELDRAPEHALVIAVEVDGELVAYVPEQESLHRLDPVATSTWHLLDGVTPLRQTVAELAGAYGAAPSVVAADVLALVATLTEQGLLLP